MITQCQTGDLCCPPGCNNNNDRDCAASCGNGVVEAGETCDPRSSCPIICSDGNACTVDFLTGSAANCNVTCAHMTVSQCQNGDGCCPPGCTIGNDSDCFARCGDNVVSPPETCDPPSTCPLECDDGDDCTLDRLLGSPASCSATCEHQVVTPCP